MKLFEASKNAGIHIYQDDKTGNKYYFDGKKLVLIGKAKQPTIGDKGDEEEQEEEQKYHDEQIAKDKEENPDAYEEEESEEDRQARLDRIRDMLSDDEVGSEIEKETTNKVNKELKKIKAKENEAKKYSSDIQRFQESLKKFIADQLKKIRVNTWKVANQRYEGSGIIRKGKRKEQNKIIPLINVYFDQSGSWGPSDIKIGEEAIGVLNNYVERGEIKIDVYYFGNKVGSTPYDIGGRGTGAGKELIDHVIATKPTNVIVMTDDDFDSWNEITQASKVVVPGAVWFLFRGRESHRLQDHLRGRSQTKKFFI